MYKECKLLISYLVILCLFSLSLHPFQICDNSEGYKNLNRIQDQSCHQKTEGVNCLVNLFSRGRISDF